MFKRSCQLISLYWLSLVDSYLLYFAMGTGDAQLMFSRDRRKDEDLGICILNRLESINSSNEDVCHAPIQTVYWMNVPLRSLVGVDGTSRSLLATVSPEQGLLTLPADTPRNDFTHLKLGRLRNPWKSRFCSTCHYEVLFA